MKRLIYIILLLSCVLLTACKNEKLIPKSTFTQIVTDIFLADQYFNSNSFSRSYIDTVMVYESIFNKYGYTYKDYVSSMNKYIEEPLEFALIFHESKAILSKMEKEMSNVVNEEQELEKVRRSFDRLKDIALEDLTYQETFIRSIFFPNSMSDNDMQYVNEGGYGRKFVMGQWLLMHETPDLSPLIRQIKPKASINNRKDSLNINSHRMHRSVEFNEGQKEIRVL